MWNCIVEVTLFHVFLFDEGPLYVRVVFLSDEEPSYVRIVFLTSFTWNVRRRLLVYQYEYTNFLYFDLYFISSEKFSRILQK